jgi:hypothetical protein
MGPKSLAALRESVPPPSTTLMCANTKFGTSTEEKVLLESRKSTAARRSAHSTIRVCFRADELLAS